MPIKVRLHNSTSEVKASGDSGTIADKRLEILLNKEIERAMAEEAHLQDEIDDVSGYSARDIRVDLQSDGSIEISLLNDAGEDVGHTRTIEITKKIIKEASLNYSESKVVFTCEDDSTIELDISDIVAAISQVASDLSNEVTRATDEEQRIETKAETLVSDEETRASNVEDALDNKIDQEISDRQSEITRVEGLLDAEVTRATTAEDGLQEQITENAGDIDDLENALAQEVQDRTDADSSLDSKIEAETTRAEGVESNLNTAIRDEATARSSADTALGNRIDALDLNTVGSDGGYIKTVGQLDGQLSATRQAFDTTIDTNSDDSNAPTSKAVKDYTDAETTRATTAESGLGEDIEKEATARSNADLALENTIKALDLAQVGANGSYIKLVSQNDGKLSATAQAFDTTLASATDNNAPTSKTVKDYVDTYGGKIDTVSIDGTNQPIVNKNVDLPAYPTKASLGLDNVVNTGDSATPVSGGTTKFTTGGAYTLQDTLQTNITNVDNKLDVNVHIEGNSDEITYNGDTVTKTSPYKNLKSGTTGSRSEVIHLANTTTAGLMSHTDYNQIRDNTSRIEALEGTKVRIEYTASSNPTASQIKTFVDNYLLTARGITNPTDEDYNSVSVVIRDTKHIWNYYANNSAYQDDGLDTVTQFTNSVAGIILGSSNDGQVYAENDGTGSVYGWSALKTRVSNLETNDVTNVAYDTTNKKLTKTINGTTSDVVTAATLKTDMSLNNVDNTSDATKKTNFTGSIASGNTGFVTGGDVCTALDNKVDKVSGKQLSTNDFTNTLKDKLDGIESGAEVNDIVGVQVNGNDLTPDANRKVNVDLSNYVTLNTAQTITAKKTIQTNDQSALEIRQGSGSTANRVGIQLTDPSGTELGFFQYNSTTKKTVFGCTESNSNQLAFRSYVNGHAYNVNVPKGASKDSAIGSGDLNLPLAIKVSDSSILTASNGGLIDMSSTLAGYVKPADLATVATSGSYADLLNKPHLASYVDTSAGRIAYLEDVNYTSASASGTDTFVKSINGGSGTFSATTKYLGVDYTAGSAITSTTKKYMEFTAPVLATSTAYEISDVGSLPSLTISDSSSSGSTAFVSGISSTGASGTGKYMHFSAGTTPPSSASPSHTSTTSGSNSGTNFNAVTGYPNFSGGSGSLTSNDTSSDGIKYISEASHTAASLGTASTGTVSISGGSYSLSSTRTTSGSGSSARRSLTISLSGSAPTLGGTKTFVTGYPNFSGGSASHTTKYLHHSHTGASLGTPSTSSASPGNHTHSYDKTTSVSLTSGTAPSLTFNSTSTGGEYYVTSVSGGTTSATTKYMAFSAGSLPTRSSFTYATGSFSTAASLNFDASELRVNAHPYISNATSGSVIGGSVSLSTYDSSDTGRVKYLQDATHTHTAASVATSGSAVTGITSGSVTKTTKYLDLDEPSE